LKFVLTILDEPFHKRFSLSRIGEYQSLFRHSKPFARLSATILLRCIVFMLKPETICTINGYGMVNAAHINENWPTLLCRPQERFSR
jgi:hypothetical protein